MNFPRVKDRLPGPYGALIDRARPITFTFEGMTLNAFQGDTIASALAANDVTPIGRSFKYHRPRAILSLDGSDSNLLVNLDGVPNQPAESTQLNDGAVVLAQNYRGSLQRDRWALPSLLARFLPVGFYYWAFFRPRIAWKFWEKIIRARAGLGVIDPEHDWRRARKEYDWADVVVIGAGPAGLAAATAAGAAGADVLVLDKRRTHGGIVAPDPAPHIRLSLNSIAHGIYADGWVAASRDGRLLKVRAGRIVLATGVLQQPAVFRNNDRPGVMLGVSAVTLIRDYGVLPGRNIVVVATDADGYEVAREIWEAGVDSMSIIDVREAASPDSTMAETWGATVLRACVPIEAIGAKRVEGLVVRYGGDGDRTIPCDLVCLCGGTVPDAALWGHAGGTLAHDREDGCWRLAGAADRVIAAGAVNGHSDPGDCALDGTAAGRIAAFAAGIGDDPRVAPPIPSAMAGSAPIIVPHGKGAEFVDFDEDLTVQDLRAGIAQGFEHAQLLKRYTTLGMGPSQGRHALLAATEIAADARGEDPGAVGTTTFRPPAFGPSFATIAGEAFQPERVTPMDGWHREAGARMMVAGDWWRPAHYGDPPLEEARWVRKAVGVIDVSSLGKMEIRGPDAAAFMERLYTFRFEKQPVGRSRYALMLDETGAIIDDGVACRLADDHFYVTTTTGASIQIYRSMLWWNLHWGFEVDITNVTGAYAAINIAGPLSRRVLSRIAGLDVGAGAFPYLAVREGEIAGVPARIMRIGFVGELGFEIHTPSGYGAHVWRELLANGADEGIRPFGVEAQRLLRLEKGHIIVGQDSDALSFPHEVGLDWAVADKPDFVGKRSMEIHNRRGANRTLVGFRLSGNATDAPKEGNVTLIDGAISGRVTSSGFDTGTGAAIGLAYIQPIHAGAFNIKLDSGKTIRAEITPLPFYDPDNARQEIDP